MSTPRACVELSQRAMDAIERIKKEFNLRYDSEAVVLAINEAETITPGLPELERVKTMTYRQPEKIEQKVSMLADQYNISKRHVVESALYALSLTYSINHRCKFSPGQDVWILEKGKAIPKKIIEIILSDTEHGMLGEFYLFNNMQMHKHHKDRVFSTREECEAHYGL